MRATTSSSSSSRPQFAQPLRKETPAISRRNQPFNVPAPFHFLFYKIPTILLFRFLTRPLEHAPRLPEIARRRPAEPPSSSFKYGEVRPSLHARPLLPSSPCQYASPHPLHFYFRSPDRRNHVRLDRRRRRNNSDELLQASESSLDHTNLSIVFSTPSFAQR